MLLSGPRASPNGALLITGNWILRMKTPVELYSFSLAQLVVRSLGLLGQPTLAKLDTQRLPRLSKVIPAGAKRPVRSAADGVMNCPAGFRVGSGTSCPPSAFATCLSLPDESAETAASSQSDLPQVSFANVAIPLTSPLSTISITGRYARRPRPRSARQAHPQSGSVTGDAPRLLCRTPPQMRKTQLSLR